VFSNKVNLVFKKDFIMLTIEWLMVQFNIDVSDGVNSENKPLHTKEEREK
jgi:hypothetical protein